MHDTDASGFHRIMFFSDAIIAIAITLFALDLRLPEPAPSLAAYQLPQYLRSMIERFWSFALGFIVITQIGRS